jgi:hypothetical protein
LDAGRRHNRLMYSAMLAANWSIFDACLQRGP